MENQTENIDNLLNKLKVLDSRIHKLETLTDEVLNEVELTYRQQLKELYQKKDIAQQKISKLQKVGDND